MKDEITNSTMTLGERMKSYENQSRIYLTTKQPVIIRIDGKAFHTFTKGLKKPFDIILGKAMSETAEYLCKNIMNCKFAYTQSDEISLLLIDYFEDETQPWFNNNLQKIASVSASMATLYFNKFFELAEQCYEEVSYADGTFDGEYANHLLRCCKEGAMFDARAFILPKHEITNYFIWRQQDAMRNSIEALARTHFSQKEMFKKSCADLKKMLITKGINWETDYEGSKQRGSCVIKCAGNDGRSIWVQDKVIPIFSVTKEYIDKHLSINEQLDISSQNNI